MTEKFFRLDVDAYDLIGKYGSRIVILRRVCGVWIVTSLITHYGLRDVNTICHRPTLKAAKEAAMLYIDDLTY